MAYVPRVAGGLQFSHTLRCWDGYLVQADQAFCKALGRPLQTLINLNILDVTYGADHAVAEAALDALRQQGDPVRVVKRYVTFDGHLLWARSHMSVLQSASGGRTIAASHEFLPDGCGGSDIRARWSAARLPETATRVLPS